MKLAALFKSTLFYTVIGFLPVASQAILAPLFSNYLTKYEYGIINLLNIFAGYLTVFIGLGFESAFSVFYFYYYKKEKWLNRLISTVFISIIFFAIVSLVLVIIFQRPIFSYFGEDDKFDFSRYLVPVFFICLTTVFFTLIQYLFRNEENIKLYAFFSISFFLLVSGGQYLGLVFISADSWGITTGRMIASVLMGVIMLVYSFKKAGIFFSFRFFKKCLEYAYPMAIYGLLWIAFENIDKLRIDRSFGKQMLGVYGIAVLFNSLLELTRTSFVYAINPTVYKNIGLGDNVSKDNIQTSIRFFVVALCNATAILMAVSWPLLHFFINAKFHEAIVFIPVLFLAVIPRIYFSYFAMPLFYFGKTKPLAVINLFSLVISWVYLQMIGSSAGPVGVCFVVVLAKLIQCLGVWVYVNRVSNVKVKYGFAMIGKDNLIVLVTALGLVGVVIVTSVQTSFSEWIYALPLLTVLVTLSFYGKRIWSKSAEALRSFNMRP